MLKKCFNMSSIPDEKILEIITHEGLLTPEQCKSIISKAPEQRRRLTQLKRVKAGGLPGQDIEHPVTIIEKREIRKLIHMDFIVICCGGGGIPVIREGRRFSGVDAVIDKDLASAKLAQEIEADIFLIATDEQGVFLNYGTPDQEMLVKQEIVRKSQILTIGFKKRNNKAEASKYLSLIDKHRPEEQGQKREGK